MTTAIATPVNESTIGTMTCANLAALRCAPEVCAGLVVIKGKVDVLPVHALHCSDAMDCFSQRAIGDRVGLMGGHKCDASAGQPHNSHEEQHRHHCQRQQPQPKIEPEHRDDYSDEQHDVTDRKYGRFEKLLHRVDVTLQSRHQAADLGLVHEAKRNPLQVREHRPPDIKQHVFSRLADNDLLHIAGPIVDQDRKAEQHHGPTQNVVIRSTGSKCLCRSRIE